MNDINWKSSIRHRRLAESFISDSISYCELYIKMSKSDQMSLDYHTIYKALWHSSTISFMKVFSTGKTNFGNSVLKKYNNIDKQMFDQIKDERNKFMAHFDDEIDRGLIANTEVKINSGSGYFFGDIISEELICESVIAERLLFFKKSLKLLKTNNDEKISKIKR